MIADAYHCLDTMWYQCLVPKGWCIYSKVPANHSYRGIALTVNRTIAYQIISSPQQHQVSSLSQHGYLAKSGTDPASLQPLNTPEMAWEDQCPLYGCSWDIKKAYDSASDLLILLCR